MTLDAYGFPKKIVAPVAVTDPELQFVFFEDFVTLVGLYGWTAIATTLLSQANGVVHTIGNTGFITSGGFCFLPSKNPALRCRFAQFGVGAFSRWIGFSDADLTVDPTNGIFFRFAGVAGNLVAVCRSAGVETVLDTGLAMANGVFHSGRLIAKNAGAAVDVWVDGIFRGTIGKTIPAATLLKLSAGTNDTVGSSGIDTDYFHVTADR